jgi:small conductance mechanosensitive channel
VKAILPDFLKPYADLIQGSALAIGIFIIGWMLSKWAHAAVLKLGRKRDFDEALVRFLGAFARYTVILATVLTALGAVGVKTTSFVAIFASAGLAVGLALQGNLAHFASGVMILLFRPFTIDHFVEIAGKTGTVKDIGLFATTLSTPNNETIIIPNGKITGDVITNYTVSGTRRGTVGVGAFYGCDVKKTSEVLLAAVKELPMVLKDPEPAVALTNLGASSVDFTLFAWCETAEYLAMLAAMRQAAYDSLNEAGIEIPFNQIVVHQAPTESDAAA